MKNNKWNLKSLLNDSNLIKDIKTVISFLLAYGIAVVSNGLIEGFTPQALVSISVSLGAIGTFFAIKIITNEFTDRGMFDEEESNESLKEKIKTQKKLSEELNLSKSYELLNEYNKERFDYLRKYKFDEIKQKYELEQKRIKSIIDNIKSTTKKGFIQNRILNRYNKKLKKVKSKLSKLSIKDIYVKYKPITLHQIRTSDFNEKQDKFNESQRFSITPQSKVRRQMTTTNFIKTFFFVGFQGAAIATITSWIEFIIFLVLMTLTLATTAITAYVSTRRFANFNYQGIIDEKIEKLNWLLKKQSNEKNPN